MASGSNGSDQSGVDRRAVGLRTRLSRLVVAICAMAIITTATFLGMAALRASNEQLRSDGTLLATLLAESVAKSEAGAPGDVDRRARMIFDLVAQSDRIGGVWLFDAGHNLVLSRSRKPLTSIESDLIGAVLASGRSTTLLDWTWGSVFFVDAPALLVAVPVNPNGGPASGVVLLRMATDQLNERARTEFLVALVLCAALILLSRWVTRLVVLRATAPLNTLNAVIGKISESSFRPKDDLKETLEGLRRSDVREVAVLADGFSTMLITLENYLRSFNKSREEKAVISQELSAAHTIQMGLLPRGFDLPLAPNVDLFALIEPAKAVGGDLYDFFVIDERRFFFVIGDVSDKGVPAALFMAMTKSLLGSEVHQESESLQKSLSHVNQALLNNNPEGMFVTVLAGVLNLETGKITYADAGHEPPVVLDASGKTACCIEKVGGEPLGVFEDAEYQVGVIQLAPGDGLVLYTDGVTEAMNSAREQYTCERLVNTLSPLAEGVSANDVVNAVLRDVRAHESGVDQSDDIALLAFRWSGPPAR